MGEERNKLIAFSDSRGIYIIVVHNNTLDSGQESMLCSMLPEVKRQMVAELTRANHNGGINSRTIFSGCACHDQQLNGLEQAALKRGMTNRFILVESPEALLAVLVACSFHVWIGNLKLHPVSYASHATKSTGNETGVVLHRVH